MSGFRTARGRGRRDARAAESKQKETENRAEGGNAQDTGPPDLPGGGIIGWIMAQGERERRKKAHQRAEGRQGQEE